MGPTLVEGGRVDAGTGPWLPGKPERTHPDSWVVHAFPDNARHHNAKAPKPSPERSGRRVRPHIPPSHAPHLNPIERLWSVMHRHVTHNRFNADFRQFTEVTFAFLDETPPKEREATKESVTDNLWTVAHDRHRPVG